MNNEDFEQIYKDYAMPVFKFLMKLSGDYHVAEELTQETFVKAYQNLDAFRGECRLYVWLCQIGKNLYYNYLKKSKNHIPLAEALPILSTQDVEESALADITAKEIVKAISLLPEPYQSVLLLHSISQLSHEEIGNLMLKTAVWSRVTYYRAKKMLQEKLQEVETNEM